MRKELVKAVRKSFRQAIERDDRFQIAGSPAADPGSDIYAWPMSPGFNAFIRLTPSVKAHLDNFMVELAWSADSPYPLRSAPQNKQRLDLSVDGRIRLPSLYRERWKSALQPWWELGPSPVRMGDEFYTEEEIARRLARVPVIVDDAIDKINTYGIPFFQRAEAARRPNILGFDRQ